MTQMRATVAIGQNTRRRKRKMSKEIEEAEDFTLTPRTLF
jgi:hypothetical protein